MTLPNSPFRRTVLAMLGAGAVALALPGAALAQGQTISATDALAGVEDGSLILIDVRRPEEWDQTGVAKGAWLLDMTHEQFGPRLMAVIEQNPNHRVAIICRTGNRTGYLSKVLAKNNISGVLDVTEGMAGGPRGKGWIPTGLPIEKAQDAYDAMPKDLKAPS